MLGIDFRHIGTKNCTEYTRHIIFIEQTLIAVNYPNGLIIIADHFLLQTHIINRRVHISAIGKLNGFIHKLLIPSLGIYLCPELFRGHVYNMENIGCFLRINRIGRPKYILIRGKCLDAGLVYHPAGYGDGGFPVLTQLPEHPTGLRLGHLELFIQGGG